MSAENQFLVTISGVPGMSFFSSKTGGDPSVPVTKDFDGGSDNADISFGRTTWSDLRVGRRYDVARDGALQLGMLRRLREQMTVTVQPTNPSYVPVGPATTYTCILVGVSTPVVNANGSTPARFDLTFSVKGIT